MTVIGIDRPTPIATSSPSPAGMGSVPTEPVQQAPATFTFDEPPPQQTNLPPTPDMGAGIWDHLSASWTAATIPNDVYGDAEKKRTENAQHIFDMLDPATRSNVPVRSNMGWRLSGDHIWSNQVLAAAQEEAKTNPQKWANETIDFDAFNAKIKADQTAELNDAQKVLTQPGTIATGAADLAGGLAREIANPYTILTAPLGGEGSALAIVAKQALLGGLNAAANLPGESSAAKRLDLPAPDPMQEIGSGVLNAGLFTGGLMAVGKGISLAMRLAPGLWRARIDSVAAAAPEGFDPLAATAAIDTAETAMRSGALPQPQPQPTSGAAPSFAAVAAATDWITGRAKPDGITPLQGAKAVDAATAQLTADLPGAGPDYSLGGVGISNTPKWQAQNLTTIQAPNGQSWTVNKRAADAFSGFLNELIGMGYDVKSSGGFNYRDIRGRPGQLSEHARGLAIDLNAETNPLGGATSDLPPNVGEIARKWGLKWGGDFNGRKDPMHFEYGADGGAKGSVADGGGTYRTRAGYTGEGQVAAGDQRYNVRYEVVDATSLIRASGDLQPRDRSTIMSDAQISNIAAKLDPAQLMPAPIASHGAPVVGPDNIIESGNGRLAAIQRAYDLHPDRAAAYRLQIEAAGYQIPEGIKQPVLIARRTTEFTHPQRVNFNIRAQDGGIAQMTPTEMAQSSSRVMTAPVLAKLDLTQPLTHEANGPFVRDVLASLPATARNAMFEKDTGLLNAHGARLLNEAVFARAWSDPDMIRMFAEGKAGEMKALIEALGEAAPAWAALKADVAAGRVAPELDISAYVLDAMRMIAEARKISKSAKVTMAKAITELLAQPDLMDGVVSPLTTALVKRFWRDGHPAKTEEIAKLLIDYAAEARKIGKGGMFDSPSPVDILRTVDGPKSKAFDQVPADIGQPRGYATKDNTPARVSGPDRGWDQGAASPEAQASDEALRAGMEKPQDPPPTDAALKTALQEIRATIDPELAAIKFKSAEHGETITLADMLNDVERQNGVAAVLRACAIIPKGAK